MMIPPNMHSLLTNVRLSITGLKLNLYAKFKDMDSKIKSFYVIDSNMGSTKKRLSLYYIKKKIKHYSF